MQVFTLFPDWPSWMIVLILLVPMLPNLWCIFQAATKRFPSEMEQKAWIFVGMLFPVLGGLVYLVWGRRRVIK